MEIEFSENNKTKVVYLRNKLGTEVELISFGACLRSFSVKDKNGKIFPLTLRYEDIEEYTVRSTGNAGKTLAPNAGEISETIGITLCNGTVIHPHANKGKNSLHGGKHNSAMKNWLLSDCAFNEKAAWAEFCLHLPDDLDGWPGERDLYARYELDEKNSLKIEYTAFSNRPSYLNISNHSYWNLNGKHASALSQYFKIDAEGMYCNGEGSLPNRIISKEEILRESGIDISAENKLSSFLKVGTGEFAQQVLAGNGLDNGFLIRKNRNKGCPAGYLISNDSHYKLLFFTDAPSIVVYMAGNLKEGVSLGDGVYTSKNCAVALEMQAIPNMDDVGFVTPNHPFKRKIEFKLITND